MDAAAAGRPLHGNGFTLLVRIAIALVLGAVLRLIMFPAFGLGALSLFSDSKIFVSGVWSVLGAAVLVAPLLGVAVTIPLIRQAQAAFVWTLAGAYAGGALAAGYAWWLHNHSTGILFGWVTIPIIGASSGAFVGATVRKPGAETTPDAAKFDAATVAIVLVMLVAAAAVRGVIEMRNPEYLYDVAHRNVPPPTVPTPPPEPQLEPPPRLISRTTGPEVPSSEPFTTASAGTVYSVDGETLRATGPAGKELWRFTPRQFSRRSEKHTPRALVGTDGTVYLVTHSLFALSPDGRLQWSWREADILPIDAAVVLEDGTIAIAARYAVYGVSPQGKTNWRYVENPPQAITDVTLGPDGMLHVHYGLNVAILDWRHR